MTIFSGWYAAGADPAGVAPRSGPTTGWRYDINVGGPAVLYARIMRVFSERNIVDPTKPLATRHTGMTKIPLYITDFGFNMNLTGQRSWHHVVPLAGFGAGAATTLNRTAEGDPFNLGTTFALSFNGGLRFVPGGNGRIQLRIDGTNYLYQIRYPTNYYIQASDNTAVLPPTQAKSFWKGNRGISAGLSYMFFR